MQEETLSQLVTEVCDVLESFIGHIRRNVHFLNTPRSTALWLRHVESPWYRLQQREGTRSHNVQQVIQACTMYTQQTPSRMWSWLPDDAQRFHTQVVVPYQTIVQAYSPWVVHAISKALLGGADLDEVQRIRANLIFQPIIDIQPNTFQLMWLPPVLTSSDSYPVRSTVTGLVGNTVCYPAASATQSISE